MPDNNDFVFDRGDLNPNDTVLLTSMELYQETLRKVHEEYQSRRQDVLRYAAESGLPVQESVVKATADLNNKFRYKYGVLR